MTPPHIKRFEKKYKRAADAISRLDVDQELREQAAEKMTEAFEGLSDFRSDLFQHLASDPLCPCAGPSVQDFEEPCPHAREIRVAMHLSEAPDGRSAAWQKRRPVVRCVSCGARAFVPGFAEEQDRQAATR